MTVWQKKNKKKHNESLGFACKEEAEALFDIINTNITMYVIMHGRYILEISFYRSSCGWLDFMVGAIALDLNTYCRLLCPQGQSSG